MGPDWFARSAARDPAKDPSLAVLLDWLPTEGRVLEAGCGSGDYVVALAARGYDVEGIELAADLVELVHERHPDVPLGVGDALAIDRPDGHYDAYVSLGVVEHRREGPEPFLAEARRVLAPGGTLALTVPAFGPIRRLRQRLTRRASSDDGFPFFQYGFGADELVELVAAQGFDVIETRYLGTYRMLCEEVPGFLRATNLRGGRYVRKFAEKIVGSRDGHMIAVRAVVPGPHPS